MILDAHGPNYFVVLMYYNLDSKLDTARFLVTLAQCLLLRYRYGEYFTRTVRDTGNIPI